MNKATPDPLARWQKALDEASAAHAEALSTFTGKWAATAQAPGVIVGLTSYVYADYAWGALQVDIGGQILIVSADDAKFPFDTKEEAWECFRSLQAEAEEG
jgi:hypothetical protein